VTTAAAVVRRKPMWRLNSKYFLNHDYLARMPRSLKMAWGRGAAVNATAIDIHNVSKHYKVYASPQDRLKQMVRRSRIYFTEHAALKPLSLQIHRGETVGIVGTNGSGKSTLLQMICGTLTPSTGAIDTVGRISALLELGAGFNPDFSGKENIWLNASILGLSKAEITDKYEDIVEFSGLKREFLDRPVKTYSSGMYVRLAFAVAIAVDPDILIVDEALAVGDESFQRKCFARIRQLQDDGKTILFVSHAANTVIDLCSRAVLLDAGELLLDGKPKEVIASYHRMIFAPEDRRDEVRREILGQAALPVADAAQAASRMVATPETRTEYPSNGAHITDIRLTDMQGEAVSLLTKGQTYCMRYCVRFDADAEGVRVAMLIKTRTGQELAGAMSYLAKQGIERVAKGDSVDVCFEFPCVLAQGAYFVNCGVSVQQDGQDVFLHRIVDALQCKVLPHVHADEPIVATGMVDIAVRSRVQLIKND
jgi:lipopolysaccharide transport system ATP-binding protein